MDILIATRKVDRRSVADGVAADGRNLRLLVHIPGGRPGGLSALVGRRRLGPGCQHQGDQRPDSGPVFHQCARIPIVGSPGLFRRPRSGIAGRPLYRIWPGGHRISFRCILPTRLGGIGATGILSERSPDPQLLPSQEDWSQDVAITALPDLSSLRAGGSSQPRQRHGYQRTSHSSHIPGNNGGNRLSGLLSPPFHRAEKRQSKTKS